MQSKILIRFVKIMKRSFDVTPRSINRNNLQEWHSLFSATLFLYMSSLLLSCAKWHNYETVLLTYFCYDYWRDTFGYWTSKVSWTQWSASKEPRRNASGIKQCHTWELRTQGFPSLLQQGGNKQNLFALAYPSLLISKKLSVPILIREMADTPE